MSNTLTTSDLTMLRKDIAEVTSDKTKPHLSESVGGFFSDCARSLRFILTEKENIVFALLQLSSIGLGYYLWVQVLDWIPDDIWQEMRKNDGKNNGGIADLIILLWSFVCVGITAFPIGFFTSCMGASFILRFNGQKSTIVNCIHLALNRIWSIWIFSWVDGWWTVKRILERLPKKRNRTPISKKILSEAIYQAWKLATLGFLPAIISGRSIADSIKDTVSLTKNRFIDLAKLRVVYSAICWIFGIGSYVLLIFLLIKHPDLMSSENTIYNFYMLAGLPMMFASTFIILIFRPLYIISAFRIYANYMREKRITITLPQKSPSLSYSALIIFGILAVLVGTTYIYRDEIGITEILSNYENFISASIENK